MQKTQYKFESLRAEKALNDFFINELVAIDNLCATPNPSKKYYHTPWSREQFLTEFKLNTSKLFFLRSQSSNLVAGFLICRIVMNQGEIMQLAIRPELQGMGLGSDLLSRSISSLSELVTEINLEARSKNLTAIQLYNKFGFNKVGIRKNYYKLPDDDAILLSLYLKKATQGHNSSL